MIFLRNKLTACGIHDESVAGGTFGMLNKNLSKFIIRFRRKHLQNLDLHSVALIRWSIDAEKCHALYSIEIILKSLAIYCKFYDVKRNHW